jgi:hypothetical protein
MVSLSTLPSELRLAIWEDYGRSLNFYFPATDQYHPSHPLAVLQTCKLFYHEAKKSLYGNLTIHCRKTEFMVGALNSLDQDQLSSLKHLQFYANTIFIKLPPESVVQTTLPWHDALLMFPGLRLDTCTVFANPYCMERFPYAFRKVYRETERLVEGSRGWKELQYFSTDEECLVWTVMQDIRMRGHSQPGNWDSKIKSRDGVASGSGVEMSIARGSGGDSGLQYTKSEQETLERTDDVVRARDIAEPLDLETLDRGAEDEKILLDSKRSLEVMVVIRRGVGNYQVENGDFARRWSA